MSTEALQINIAQKIFSIYDEKLLHKIENIILKDNIIGYDASGNPITSQQYISQMDEINKEIDNGTAETFTSEEVFKNIKDAYGLA